MADEKEDTHANEPIGFYNSRKITFYKSFEEENEEKIAYYASLTMEERLQQLNLLLKQIYGSEFGPEKTLGTKIYFD